MHFLHTMDQHQSQLGSDKLPLERWHHNYTSGYILPSKDGEMVDMGGSSA